MRIQNTESRIQSLNQGIQSLNQGIRSLNRGRIMHSVFSDCILYSVLCIALLIISTSCSQEHDVERPQRGGNAQRSYTYYDGLDATINAATMQQLDASVLVASPLVIGARTYVMATTDHTIERYDHGKRMWSVSCGKGVFALSGMAADDKSSEVYAALSNGDVVAINVTGAVRWRVRTPDGASVASDLLLSKGRLVAVSASNHIVSIECMSGKVAYYTSTSGPLRPACCADAAGNVYVVRSDDAPQVSCIDERGSVRWTSSLPLATIRMHPMIASNNVIVGGTAVNGRGAAIAIRADGTVAWTKEFSAIPQYASCGGDSLYIVAMERGMIDRPSSRIYAISSSGKEYWNVWYDFNLRSPCYVSSDCMAVCASPTLKAEWTNVLMVYRNGRIRRLIDLGNEPLTTDLPDVETDGALVFACADTSALLRIEHKSLTDLLGR